MATIINLNAIQSVPASLLNRDDTNSAKGITLGNVRRERVSSQSWKRAIRTSMRTEAIDNGVWANRTNRLPSQVIKELVTTFDCNPDEADQVVGAVFKEMGLSRNDKGNTAATVFAASTAPQKLAELIHNSFEEIATAGKPEKAFVKEAIAALDTDSAIDLALFGRMLAEIPEGRVDGSVGVSHAFGVTPTTVEPDFFVAVDDCAEEGEPVGVNLGTTDLTSPLFYRSAFLDKGQLAHNLNNAEDLVETAQDIFIRHFVTAVPSAKQRSTSAHTLPEIVIATIGTNALSAANAYTTAITSENPVDDATNQLVTHLNYASRVTPHVTIAFPLTPGAEIICANNDVTTVASMEEFIEAIKQATV